MLCSGRLGNRRRIQQELHWDGTSYYGASLKALELIGSRKGYELVGCSLSGINAFFVRRDLVKDSFCAPFTAENHFEPPRFGFYKVGALEKCTLLELVDICKMHSRRTISVSGAMRSATY
jgi:hypothetical protein